MTSHRNFSLILMFTALGMGTNKMVALGQSQRLPPAQVTIDEDILTALVDEPCRHFEAAGDAFALRQFPQAAEHMRTATAYLRLESARAETGTRVALEASVRELLDVATATETGRIESVDTLQQAFTRAHYALASHHCVKSAHRCCRSETFVGKHELRRAGHDLRAASLHIERGLRWAGTDTDEETQRALRMSNLAAKDLRSQNNLQRAIQSLHRTLEKLAGHKILLARPLTPENEDKTGPSIFR